MYDNLITNSLVKQNNTTPFTDFINVKTDTDLSSLNLNWRERDLPEKERTKHVHRLHPYMGKFIPHLVEIFLRKFQPKLVYDPFCGSGTTLVEAKALGIDSVGVDISEFNVLLSKVKTDYYDIADLNNEINSIILNIDNNSNLTLFPKSSISSGKKLDNDYLKDWFSEQALAELLLYQNFIKEMKYSNLFKIVLSRAARSARQTTHYDLDFPKQPQKTPYECYKHSRICHPVNEANKFLKRYTLDALRRIKEFYQLSPSGKTTIIHDDSKNAKLPSNIDMVFTSPPYIGLIDYHEQHRYAYELLGLKNNEDKEIGSAKKGLSNKAKQNYINEINEVLSHTRKYMVDKGIMCIVVNDKYNLYNPKKVGFKDIGRIERIVNRRTGRRSSAFFESIFIWEKSR